ncbi:ABC transporter F family member 3-like, partial [Trifolium medium]|nr:ABC transporter F family member 3-like [Trifolium medium]
GVPEQKLRGHLGSFGVTGNLALQPMYTLSGGQKSRVAFAKITFKKPHIILLDEPSNHLGKYAESIEFVLFCIMFILISSHLKMVSELTFE